MFDRYLIVDGSLRNLEQEGQVVGFAVDTRIGYYRGLGLSMIAFSLEVDGVLVDQDDITFRVHGNEYPATGMGEVYDDRWGFTEAATLVVRRPGGLPAGDHDVHYHQWLRISYLPVPSENDDRKVLTVAA